MVLSCVRRELPIDLWSRQQLNKVNWHLLVFLETIPIENLDSDCDRLTGCRCRRWFAPGHLENRDSVVWPLRYCDDDAE